MAAGPFRIFWSASLTWSGVRDGVGDAIDAGLQELQQTRTFNRKTIKGGNIKKGYVRYSGSGDIIVAERGVAARASHLCK